MQSVWLKSWRQCLRFGIGSSILCAGTLLTIQQLFRF